ncbi:hypothetical protein [Paraburkholderia sp. Ac-20347]|uniref:hypothetical protein n=1 Tax=Paraburkholderia sp. Ac-20347 TaxID=2703892 RepID=UPI0019811099|nr:hypothetical protein [Paraburkholderia sp. Ac-20347]MBN3813278.1 hypothetical protein [Paraburkholderia sp. Ac-20347]
MTRAVGALLAALLTSCSIIEHVQVLPTVNPTTYDVSCCVVYAEIPPSTHLSITMKKANTGTTVKLGARWRF